MPGRIWYVVAVVVFFAAAGIAGIVVYSRMAALTKELPQVVVPGEADLTFKERGTYTIYLERQSVVDGRIYSTSDDISELRVRLSSASGAPIELTAPTVDSNYQLGGRSGTAVLSCTISEPGEYHLEAGYPDGRSGPAGVLAIGLGVPGKILSTILLALAIGMSGFIVSIGLAGATFWRRRKMTKVATAPPSGQLRTQ